MIITADQRKGKPDGHSGWPTNRGVVIDIDVMVPYADGQRLYPDPMSAAVSDPLLSLKAKGLLAALSWWQLSNMGLPLPPLSEVQGMSADGSAATRSAMKELIERGYAYRTQVGSVTRTFLATIHSDYAQQVDQ